MHQATRTLSRLAPSALGVRLFLAAVLLVLSGGVSAATFESGDAVTIERDRTINDDLYVAAETVRIEGTVNGDLFVIGDSIVVEGRVSGDVTVMGDSLEFYGEVGDDLRAAGAAIHIDTDVGGDIFATGASVHVTRGSTVAGDLYAAAGQVLHAGTAAGNAALAGGAVRLEGTVGGNLNVAVGEGDGDAFAATWQDRPAFVPTLPGGFTQGSDAEVQGDLTLRAFGEPTEARDAVMGDYEFKPVPRPEPRPWTLLLLERFLFWSVVGLALYALFRRRATTRLEAASGRLWRALGWGALVLFLAPLALLVLGVPFYVLGGIAAALNLEGAGAGLIGLGVGLTVLLSVGLTLLASSVAPPLTGLVLGRWVLQRTGQANSRDVVALPLGVLLIAAASLVPTVGGLLVGLAVILGVGMFVLRRNVPPAPVEGQTATE